MRVYVYAYAEPELVQAFLLHEKKHRFLDLTSVVSEASSTGDAHVRPATRKKATT